MPHRWKPPPHVTYLMTCGLNQKNNDCYNRNVNIRRYYYPGQIVFITQIVQNRKPVFNNAKTIELLRTTLMNVQEFHPFSMISYVFLPDHFHLLIRPTGQSNFSQIMHSLKFNFTNAYKHKTNYIGSLIFWQKRFWDHVIRDEIDLEHHIHYIHHNPVKHNYVENMAAWKHSSFSNWQARGLYDNPIDWTEPQNTYWGE